jgi:RNA polymerase sigma factor (sigma-70 family)
MPSMTDADLVRRAQTGDPAGLGLLLTRHRAGMFGVALSLVGYGPDAEDAMQDAALIALRRIGDLRDPDAVAPWLRAIVRNACRARLRADRPIPVDHAVLAGWPAGGPDPDELLDRHALRDWVWHALGGLTPALRMVAMLRYFTDLTDYDAIAAACAIPVGTVRSRLHQARAKLSEALLATADAAHDDVGALIAARRREAEDALRATPAAAMPALFSPTMTVFWPSGRRTIGTGYLIRAMESDLNHGVRHELANVVASRELVIWEANLFNPPDDPLHCPPGAVWLHTLRAGRVHRLRIVHKVRNPH